MADETFATNLFKMLAAELHFQNAMVAAREMFGRSYFSLGTGEKVAVDQAVFGYVANNYKDITPDFLAGQETRQPVGFGFQPVPPKQENPSGTP
jgi:hypothetical protein